MLTEEEIRSSGVFPEAASRHEDENLPGIPKDAGTRLSPERLELLKRTIEVRRRIGKLSMNVAELVHEMRETGA